MFFNDNQQVIINFSLISCNYTINFTILHFFIELLDRQMLLHFVSAEDTKLTLNRLMKCFVDALLKNVIRKAHKKLFDLLSESNWSS